MGHWDIMDHERAMGGITWESDIIVQPDCHSNSTSQRKLKTGFAI